MIPLKTLVCRNSGRKTHDQMREAPKGAVYVWSNWNPLWAQSEARNIGRRDLTVVSRDELVEHDAVNILNNSIKEIVIDHGNYAGAQDGQDEVFEAMLARLGELGWKVHK